MAIRYMHPAICSKIQSERGISAIVLVILIFIIAIASIALAFRGAPHRPETGVASTKANMNAVQLGIEQYAAEHHGYYPDCIRAPRFNWSKYVPSQPRNPYYPDMLSNRLIDRCVTVATLPPLKVARTDTNPFPMGGLVRYYVSADYKAYALSGSRVKFPDGGPFPRPIPSEFWRCINDQGICRRQ